VASVLSWRRAGVVAAVLGLVGCTSGSPTGPSPDSPVSPVGPTWRLTSVAGQAVLAGTTVTASFSTEERVSGSAGCNSYFGRARVESGRLSVGSLGSTLMACADGVMQQEMLFLASLQAATSYAVRGEELRLGPSASEVTLVFASR
jgi:heat shock protein HslJ